MYRRSLNILYSAILFVVANSTVFSQELMDEPVFSSQRGFYENNFTLKISYGTPGTTIKYTKDGTDPFTSSTAQSLSSPAALTIDPTIISERDKAPGVVIRACAMQEGIPLTKTATHTYLFAHKIEELSPSDIKPGHGWPNPHPGLYDYQSHFSDQGMNYGMDPDVLHDPRYQNVIKNALESIPTISLVTDLKNLFDPDSGIYVNALRDGSEWERRTSIELLNPDGSQGFQIDCGLRIRGAWGRIGRNYKHAFRLFFNKEYGQSKLRFPLFGDEGVTVFDNIDLRTEQNYSWAFTEYDDGSKNTELREVFSRDTQRDMGQPYTRSRYYHLYLNGTYWGVYQTQERAEASFGESYLGGTKEDYDAIKVEVGENLNIYEIEATDGTLDAYRKLWEAASEGFTSDSVYYKIQGLNPDGSRNPEYPVLVDIDNLIDYMLCTIYVADPDGPTNGSVPNNFYCMYNKNTDRGFVFFRHDAEHSLINPSLDLTLPTTVGSQFRHFNPQWLHQRLSSHPEYQLRFYDHVYKYFFNGGALTVEANSNRLLKRKAQIDAAIIAESARWGDANSNIPRTRDDDWLKEVNWILNQFFPGRTNTVLQQLRARNLYPGFDPPVFNLKSGTVSKGSQLTMSAPEGTVYYTVDGNDTHVPSWQKKPFETILVTRNAEKHILIPTADVDFKWRYSLTFDDSSWLRCNSSPGGVGYDLGSGYDDIISFDVQNQMYNKNTTCMIRIPFQVTQEQLYNNYMTLHVQYDDGFLAFLNKGGTVIRQNLSGSSMVWNSAAVRNHEGRSIYSFDLSPNISNLLLGQNMLAIQALNITPADSDFFISVELIAGNTNKFSSPISPSAAAYSYPITIDHTTKIKARVYKDGYWSALNEIFLWVPQGYDNLKITEIHYHPLDGEGVDGNEYEFIELKNIGADLLDLSEMAFTQGIEYTFPPGTIFRPGTHIVLASNAQEFAARYKFAPFGEFSGQLNNAGETIILLTSRGDTLINQTYSDKYPWPNSPDGLGYSLIRKPNEYYREANDPTAWRASLEIHGNPGTDDEMTSVNMKEKQLPDGFSLYQNYPNPFNPATTIPFSLPLREFVSLKVYDVLGREVAVLVSGQMSAGGHSVQWNASAMPSGVYFYRLQALSFTQTKKLVLIK